MPKKNPPRPLKDRDIEALLQTMISSEDEDTDDDDLHADFFDNINHRLDELQNITTDDLLDVLHAEPVTETDQESQLIQPRDLGFEENIPQLPADIFFTDPDQMLEIEANNPLSKSEKNSYLSVGPPSSSIAPPCSPIAPPCSPIAPPCSTIAPPCSASAPPSPLVNEAVTFLQMTQKERSWSTNIENEEFPVFEIKAKSSIAYNNRHLPIDYFNDMFKSDIIDILVENTNLYAIKKQSKQWLETNNEEMRAFLGVIIMMGLNPLTDVELYWSTDNFYNNPVISRVMPLKRYKKLIENFHVSNPNTELARNDPNYDKLMKIRPLIGILNNNFSDMCSQSSSQSIDESMIKYKGRSAMKQYMPNKPIKRGYKVWARCDAESGYLYSFEMYTGKSSSTDDNVGGLGYRVVMQLCRNVQPYTLMAFDNFFTSLPLLEMLHHKNIYAVGTVRVNRKGLPTEITAKRGRKDPMSLKPGEFMFQHAAPVSVVKWMDTKDVYVATTAFDPRKVQTIQRKQKDGSKHAMFCPLPIVEYTKNMGGVDHFDHFRSSYSVGRKSKKNWFRLFWFLLEAALINAYILYCQGHVLRNYSHRQFRLRVARGLVNNFTSRKACATILKNKKGGVYGIPDEVRLVNVGVHMPNAGNKRRCRFCSTRTNPKRSKIECNMCKVPLCMEPCFARFHLPYEPHNL